MDAILALEDGWWVRGRAFGAAAKTRGEIVFTTANTGYPEVLTDPSFKGQIVVMTQPHVGNYGLTRAEFESIRPWVEGFVVHEVSPRVSRPQARWSLGRFLQQHGIPGLAGIDTRALVRHIRDKGAMRAVLTTVDGDGDPDQLVAEARSLPGMVGANWVDAVTTETPYWAVPAEAPAEAWTGPVDAIPVRRIPGTGGADVEPVDWLVVYDFGVKLGIVRALLQRGWRCLVVPARTPAAAVLAWHPPGVVLSNGPGDPAALPHLVAEIQQLLGRVPLLGICLGHQLLARALDARTFKLHFGHRGINQPVTDREQNRVLITTQNHGFAVDPETLPGDLVPTHWHLNDGTLEGFRHQSIPLFAVQFHPEACPGPHEAATVFDTFLEQVRPRRTVG